jgi:hypothetical protein
MNPPPVKITFGEVTATSMEIIMEERGVALFWGNTVLAFGFGPSIPPGQGALITLEFEERPPAAGICLAADTRVFAGPEGGVADQMIPPRIIWPLAAKKALESVTVAASAARPWASSKPSQRTAPYW